MKFTHSLAFLALGFVMFKLPHWAPGLCPNDFFGNSVRATWLYLMGLTQLVIGSSFLLRGAWSWAASWLETWPEMIAASMAASAPQPERPAPAMPEPAMPAPIPQPSLADVIPVEFKPVWSEQRPAAA